MDDQELDSVRQNIAHYADGQWDRRQEWQNVFKRDDILEQALRTARKVSWLGLIPAVLVTLYFEYVARGSLRAMVLGILGIVVVGFVAPRVCALVANFWFYHSIIPLRRATIGLLLATHATFTVWLFVLFVRM